MDKNIVRDINFTELELRMLARYGSTPSTHCYDAEGICAFCAPTPGRGYTWPVGRQAGKATASTLRAKLFGSLCAVGDGPERFTTGRIAGAVRSALADQKLVGNSSGAVTGRFRMQYPQYQRLPKK